LDVFEKLETPTELSMSLNLIGKIYLETENIDSCIITSNKALTLAKEMDNKITIKNAAETLYKAYNSINNTEKALSMHVLFSELKDSINSMNNHKKIIHQEYQNKYDKKQREAKLVIKKEKEKSFASGAKNS
jgi:hypothetical protein